MNKNPTRRTAAFCFSQLGLRRIGVSCAAYLISLSAVLFVCATAVAQGRLLSDEGVIENLDGASRISVWVLQPGRYAIDGKHILVSVELAKEITKTGIEATVKPFIAEGKVATEEFAPRAVTKVSNPYDEIKSTLPPNPNEGKVWHVFRLELPPHLLLSPFQVIVTVPQAGIKFARILLGQPSTLRSNIIGAFSPAAPRKDNAVVIKAGEDYLGTTFARQRIRLPAGAFGAGSEAFDEIVEFGELRLDPKRLSNADTIMIRMRDISAGETTPLRLVAFANKSTKPITIRTPKGNIELEITSTLSPNAVSSGFITLNEDGSYESSTCLYPVLSLQPVAAGIPQGEPMVIDTALTQVPSFPFYLASDGGRWAPKKPAGRLETLKSSNFFNDNGTASKFNHSNGKGTVIGKCAKEGVTE